MSNNLKSGFGNPENSREDIVAAAAGMFCTICGGRPCYLLATTAITVMHDQLRKSEDLVSTARYMQHLLNTQRCLERHIKNYLAVAKDCWGLDDHFNFTEEKLANFRKHGVNVEELQTTLQLEIQNGGPQNPN